VTLEAVAPSARYVVAMLALMFVVSGACEPSRFSPSTPRRANWRKQLFRYSIEPRPDAGSLALPGVEMIDIEVREPTARLTLNAVNTTFASVTVDDSLARADVTRQPGRRTQL
jgi:hypothetical protein